MIGVMEKMYSKLSNINDKLDRAGSSVELPVEEKEEISCPNCKKTISADSDFCEFCGYKLT
jgi:rRNA maturation endonuclease Nob1